MKLRTEIDDFLAEVWTDDLRHDAMAAHALLQAIAGLRSGASEEQVLAYDVALKRAAEILAGWMGEDRG